jgi:hypothetical protein
MTEEQVRTTMRARGYSDIEGLARVGDTFRVSEAKRYGEKVGMSASMPPPAWCATRSG